jgi:hypothetical protein
MKLITDYASGFFLENAKAFKNLKEPVHIALSGGRSSAAMLRMLLDVHDGKLPTNYFVIFTNTGKEVEETYLFLKEIEERWQVLIHWLELTEIETGPGTGKHGIVHYKGVNFETASRKGEPFEIMLGALGMVPRRNRRLCTFYMKVRVADAFCTNYLSLSFYVKMLGFRADEHKWLRRALLKCGAEKLNYRPEAPLLKCGINKQAVLSFWEQQEFNLAIDSKWGNCDFCFMKDPAILLQLAQEKPGALQWWVAHDGHRMKRTGENYYMLPDGGYPELQRQLQRGGIPDPNPDDDITDLECGCTD